MRRGNGRPLAARRGYLRGDLPLELRCACAECGAALGAQPYDDPFAPLWLPPDDWGVWNAELRDASDAHTAKTGHWQRRTRLEFAPDAQRVLARLAREVAHGEH